MPGRLIAVSPPRVAGPVHFKVIAAR